MIRLNDDGRVSFEFYRAEAREVSISGSFNGWSPGAHVMKKQPDGHWSLDLELPPGEYEFQYLVDGRHWYPDFAAHGVEMDDLGGWRSLLSVPQAEADEAFEFDGPTAFEQVGTLEAINAGNTPDGRRAA